MATETNDTNGQDTNNNGNVIEQSTDTGTDNLTSDPILSKHLDMAIEAQDGPKAKSTDKNKDGETSDKTEGSKTAKADSTSSTNDTDTQQKSDKETKEKSGDTRGPKDLILKGQGPDGTDLVIKGGSERRFYEQLQTSRQRQQFLENEIKTRDDKFKDIETKFNTLNQTLQATSSLPPQHLAVAVRMFSDLQRDPAGTLKKLLAEAVSLGHTVEGIGSGVDAAAIEAAIERKLGATQTAREPTEQEIATSAEQQVTSFYSRFPDARPHDALLGAVLRDHPDLSLEAAYFQLKDAFAEKGFDWTRSLEDNVKEASSSASTQEQQTTINNKRPLPGGGNAATGSEPIEKHKDVVMSENADMGDIVKAAMRESGLNV